MNVQIREYNDRDKKHIIDCVEKLHDHVVSLDPLKRLRKMPGYIDTEVTNTFRTVKEQNGKILIAEDDGKFVGFIVGFMTKQSDENLMSVVPTKLGVISDVYVSDAYRGQGVGEKLMRAMEAYLKTLDCDTIWINIVSYNTNAHSFYKKMGYHDREISLMKKLD